MYLAAKLCLIMFCSVFHNLSVPERLCEPALAVAVALLYYYHFSKFIDT